MFKVVAQCGSNYGIVDTADNVVEWVDKSTLQGYTEAGYEIEGVSVSDTGVTVQVNPVYYVPYAELRCSEDTNLPSIFNRVERVTRGYRNVAEFFVDGKKYKLRKIMPLAKDSTVSYEDMYSFVADISGIMVKLSNGICTILPLDMYSEMFQSVIRD